MRVWAALAVAILGAGSMPAPAYAGEPAGWLPLFAADFSGGQLPAECRAKVP